MNWSTVSANKDYSVLKPFWGFYRMFKMYLLGASNILLTADIFNYFYCIQLNLEGLANHEFLVIFCSGIKPRHLNQNHATRGSRVAAGFKNQFIAL